jgi:hypothetical protein
LARTDLPIKPSLLTRLQVGNLDTVGRINEAAGQSGDHIDDSSNQVSSDFK